MHKAAGRGKDTDNDAGNDQSEEKYAEIGSGEVAAVDISIAEREYDQHDKTDDRNTEQQHIAEICPR